MRGILLPPAPTVFTVSKGSTGVAAGVGEDPLAEPCDNLAAGVAFLLWIVAVLPALAADNVLGAGSALLVGRPLESELNGLFASDFEVGDGTARPAGSLRS